MKKNTSKTSTNSNGVVGKTQASILKALIKADRQLSRPDIAVIVGKQGGSVTNGRVSDEAGNYGALVKAKYIKEFPGVVVDGGRPTTEYAILSAGRKAYEAFVAASK